MRIECDACMMQHTEVCNDCVVAVLLEMMPGAVEIGDADAEALGVLAEAGLVPRLRVVPRHPDSAAS